MIRSKYYMAFDTDALQDQIEIYFEAFSRLDVYKHTCDVLSTYNKIVELLDISEPLKTRGRDAVMLHDIGRVVNYSELVKFCEENGRFASEKELKAIGILHQFASKYIAMHTFGIEDEMTLNAIECHTTLKGNPSIVDKLVFLSDKLSWKEEESAELIRKMKAQLTLSIDLSLYEYHKVMYDNREAMMCYHEWSNDAYHYLSGIISAERMDIVEHIKKRRSIRKFEHLPLSEELINNLLIAATAAPTAANCEPWEFIVIRDENILKEIYDGLVFARYKAPLAIVVCGNMDLAFKGPGKEMWVQDCSAATQNMLIAAANLGLGSVWVGIYPLDSNVSALRKILNIPDHVIPLNVVYFGYPAEVKEARSRLNMKRVYYDKYDPNRKHRKKDKPKIGHY